MCIIFHATFAPLPFPAFCSCTPPLPPAPPPLSSPPTLLFHPLHVSIYIIELLIGLSPRSSRLVQPTFENPRHNFMAKMLRCDRPPGSPPSSPCPPLFPPPSPQLQSLFNENLRLNQLLVSIESTIK